MQETKYFSHAWKLLTGNKGWFKVVLLLALCEFVPILGFLGVLGYLYEWARLVAWGAEAAPKQKNIDIGGCVKGGWRVFVVMLGYGLVCALIYAVLANAFGDSFEGWPSFLIMVLMIFVNTFIEVAGVRASIYQGIGAGYRVDRLWDMVKRDAGGFAKVTGIKLLVELICGAIMIVPMMIFIFYLTGAAISAYSATSLLTGPSNMLGQAMTTSAIFVAVAMVLGSFEGIINTLLMALWIRQFNVPAWGASKDPLPEPAMASVQATLPPVPLQGQQPPQEPYQGAGTSYGQQGQQGQGNGVVFNGSPSNDNVVSGQGQDNHGDGTQQ